MTERELERLRNVEKQERSREDSKWKNLEYVLYAITISDMKKQIIARIADMLLLWMAENDLPNRRQKPPIHGIGQQNLQESYILVQITSSLAFGGRCETEEMQK